MTDPNILGTKGESDFSSWCIGTGIRCNNSYNLDLDGWDCILEFNQKKNKKIPLDRQSVKIELKVQVKSTESKRKKQFKISLKNLYNLVQYDYPVFFCMIYYDKVADNLIAKKVSLLHMDKEIIKETLKTIRELEKNNQTNKINEKYLYFSHKDAFYVNEKIGSEIKKNILETIPKGINNYTQWKKNLRKTIGNCGFIGRFSITADDPYLILQEHLLGYREKININNLEISDLRFNIDILIKKEDFAFLEFKNIEKKVRVIFKDNQYSEGIDLKWDLFSTSSMNNILPKEYHKFELRYGPLKLYSNNNKLDFNVNIDYNNNYSFDILYNVVNIFSMLNNASINNKNIIIRIFNDSKFTDINTDLFKINCNEINKIINLLNILKKLDKIFCLYNDDFRLSISDLINSEEQIKKCEILFNDSKGDINITYHKKDFEYSKMKEIYFPIIQLLKLGDWLFVFNLYFFGKSKIKCYTDSNYVKEIKILNTIVNLLKLYKIYKYDNQKVTIKDLLKESWEFKNKKYPDSVFLYPKEYENTIKNFIYNKK